MLDTDALGRHLLLELYDCPAEKLYYPTDSEEILLNAAKIMGATVIEAKFHAFNPHGVSGVVIIAESHLTVHTWPEHAYAAVDIFSCGNLMLAEGVESIIAGYEAARYDSRSFARGLRIENRSTPQSFLHSHTRD